MQPPPVLDFGYPPATLRFWRERVRAALAAGAQTPCFVGSPIPIEGALEDLGRHDFGAPVRHWLSCKTQPVPAVLEEWRRQGRPIEVVSEFEYRLALAAGFAPTQILVNGPCKQRWLSALAQPGLAVNFDSRAELDALLDQAKAQRWRVGLRLRTEGEMDPENRDRPTQFGFEPAEWIRAAKLLRRRQVELTTVSFHLRTNVPDPSFYERALVEAASVCTAAHCCPAVVDTGGGLPPPYVLSRRGRRLDAGLELRDLAASYRHLVRSFPGLKELWFENGRFLLARSAVLVVQVLEIKERLGLRQLICDGGRTLNALVSTWEHHALLPLLERRGPTVPTVVHGPTCMAFDQLAYIELPQRLRVGDRLIWFEAGAYHVPWETHFSHGLAGFWWEGPEGLRCVRAPESFAAWAARWQSGPAVGNASAPTGATDKTGP